MPSDYRFPPEHRVRKRDEYQRVFAGRKVSVRDDVLLIFGQLNGLPHPRLGTSVGKKVGNAVVRNRWKRCLREAFRLNRHKLPSGVDLVVIPVARCRPTLALVERSFAPLARRLARKLPPRENRDGPSAPPSEPPPCSPS